MRVGVLDHGMGNLRSVAKALAAAGGDPFISSVAGDLARADALCVPGQGIFGRCVDNMTAGGLAEHVAGWIARQRPYLGICLGMQILFETSDEGGGREGLGFFGGHCRKLAGEVSIPHIGWNTVGDEYFYFDHSYAVFPKDDSIVSGWCDHGQTFAARIEHDSVLGVQFHPEKSGGAGITLLRKWVEGSK